MVKDKRTDEEIQKEEEDKIKADEERINRLQQAAANADIAAERLLRIETRVKMGGQAEVSKEEVKKEFSPKEYVKLVMEGKIPEQQK